jgi:hypothetical protein
MAKRIVMTLTLEVEGDGAEIVSVQVGDTPRQESATGVPSPVRELIREYSSPAMAPFVGAFAERCAAELELSLERPESGERKYVNGYPPKRYGAKRAVAFDAKSGRAEIYCRPENADGRDHAEAVLNNGVPFAVKVYLQSPDAVDEAVELTKIGLQERER